MEPSRRGQVLRSLATLRSAHADFLNQGNGNISIVKNYHNALGEPFFDIPLDQVIIRMWSIDMYN